MRLDQTGHAAEAEIVFRHFVRVHGRAEAILVVPAKDPAGGEAMRVRRPVVVEHALGRMQDLVLLNPERLELRQHVLEIAARRFVGTNVLGGVDRVEVDLQLLVAARKTLVVDIL